MQGCDDRFSYRRFCTLPIWLVRQGLRQVRQQRNYDQITQAKMVKHFLDAHTDLEKHKPADINSIMPFPSEWMALTGERTLNISSATALEFLNTYKKYGVEVVGTFDDWIDEIKLIAGS